MTTSGSAATTTPAFAPRTAPVVVTGMARAGTSWVGKLLQASGELTYINEPLNPNHPPGRSPGVFNAPVPVERHYQYIGAHNEDGWLAPFRETLGLRYHVAAELRQNRSAYDLARMARYASSFLAGRLLGRRALLDDPYTLLASGWLAGRLGCRVVAVMRDPAAMVASWKRLGWTTDLSELLGQPDLMRDWLAPYRAELEAVAGPPTGTCRAGSGPSGGCCTWSPPSTSAATRACASSATRTWSRTPVASFAELFGWLGLHFDRAAERAVVRSTSGSTSRRAHTWSLFRSGLSKTGYRPMDSRANLVAWRRQLSDEEVARVRAVTAEVAGRWDPAQETQSSNAGGREQ